MPFFKANVVLKVLRFALDHPTGGHRPPKDVARAIQSLWNTETIQRCYNRRNEFQLNDSAAYFLSSAERVCSSNYVPTDEVRKTEISQD